MRVALITFFSPADAMARAISGKLEAGSVSRGNVVAMINGHEDPSSAHLAIYDYIAVAIRPAGFVGGKVPENVRNFLRQAGGVSGKKGCAIVLRQGLSSGKTYKNLMRLLEAEGMRLDYSEIVRDVDHAFLVGTKIG